MAWSTPKTFVATDVLTASEMNTYVSDNTDFLNKPPSARVYNSADISVNNNTVVALTFNSERWDTDTIHSTVTNTGRLTCRTSGLYQIFGCIAFASSTDVLPTTDVSATTDIYTSLHSCAIRLNGTSVIAVSTVSDSVDSTETRLAPSTIYSLSVDDYVELTAYQTSGYTFTVKSASNYSPEFGMTYLGKVS